MVLNHKGNIWEGTIGQSVHYDHWMILPFLLYLEIHETSFGQKGRHNSWQIAERIQRNPVQNR